MEPYSKHTKCLISGSEILKPLKGYEKDFLVKSKPVGFVFCSRIPTADELSAHYNKYSREDYLSPLTVKRYHQLLDEFEPYRQTGRILDVGCGVGFFLSVAKERGWEVYGTEYTDKAIAKCREKGINMQQGKLDPAWFPEGYFDIISSFEVIEHINNPVEEVTNMCRLLRKGGLFYFTTPNFNALERYLLKDKYNIIEYPEHLSYYTKRTVNYLLTHQGFARKKLVTTGVSVTRIKTSLRMSRERYVSSVSTDENIRLGMEKSGFKRAMKNAVNGLLNLFGIGNSLKGWYIKK